MSGIFDAIFGSNSGAQQGSTQPAATPAATPAAAPTPTPDVTDAQGLSSGDRAQAGFSGLTQLGATLLAAGQPMWGPDRARVLAGLGNVPEAMQQSMAGAVGRRKAGQQMQMTKAQLDAMSAMKEMANGDMSAYSPEMQSLMKAAFLSGKPETALAAMKEAREATQPVPLGQGMFWDRKSNTAINPLFNIRIPLDANGTPQGQGTYGKTGNAVEQADMQPDPDTGLRETWLGKQGHDGAYDARLKRIARGDEQFPGMRDPMRYKLLNDLSVYAPDVREQDYKAKEQAIKAVQPGGKSFDTIIRPGSAFLDHSASLAKATDALDLDDGTVATNGGNWLKLKMMKNGAGEDQQKVAAWEEYKGKVVDEFNKFMRGNGGLTDQAQREGQALKDAKTPAEIKGRLQAMTEMMHGQLKPVADAYHQSLKKPSAQPEEMLGKTASSSLNSVTNWINGQSRGGGSPSAGPSAAGGSNPPVQGAKQAPDGKWYVADPARPGKFLRVDQ